MRPCVCVSGRALFIHSFFVLLSHFFFFLYIDFVCRLLYFHLLERRDYSCASTVLHSYKKNCEFFVGYREQQQTDSWQQQQQPEETCEILSVARADTGILQCPAKNLNGKIAMWTRCSFTVLYPELYTTGLGNRKFSIRKTKATVKNSNSPKYEWKHDQKGITFMIFLVLEKKN